MLGKFVGGANPVGPAKPGTPYFMHADRHGSTSVLTAEDASVYESLEYFPDGEQWIDRAPQKPFNHYLFSGKPFDPDTGFYDFGQRFYDARTSLWLGVDSAFKASPSGSITRPTSLSVFSFSAHNPFRFFDPDGRDPLSIEEQANGVCYADATCSGGSGGILQSSPVAWERNSQSGEWEERLPAFDYESWDAQILASHSVASSRLGAQGRSKTAYYHGQHASAAEAFNGPRWWQTAGKVLLVAAVFVPGVGEAELAEAGAALEEGALESTVATEVGEATAAEEIQTTQSGLRSWKEAKISPNDAKRIQNAANRTKQRITVVGSRASGTANPESDWDYVMYGSSRARHSARSSVPRGAAGGEIGSSGRESGIDVFKPPVAEELPHCVFDPEAK